jgi:hypothetical protein
LRWELVRSREANVGFCGEHGGGVLTERMLARILVPRLSRTTTLFAHLLTTAKKPLYCGDGQKHDRSFGGELEVYEDHSLLTIADHSHSIVPS